MVFVTAGEGGGTGTGGAPVVARIARSLGRADHRRRDPAVRLRGPPPRQLRPRRASPSLREEVDTLIVIPNDRLLSISDRNVSVLDAFKQADQVLLQGVSGITDLITTPGLINLDFADVKSVMANAGSALMGIGSARGEDRAVAAAEMAVSSPLLEASIDGAHGVLLSIAGGSDLGLFEINEAAALVSQAAHPEANIIFGATIDDALGDEVRVTVIAAGFDGGMPKRREQPSPGFRRTPGRSSRPRSRPGPRPRRSRPSRPGQPRQVAAGAAQPRARRCARAASQQRPAAPGAVRRRRPRRPGLPEVGPANVGTGVRRTSTHGPVELAFTDRHGGVSGAPVDSLNLAWAGGDDPAAVAENHRLLTATSRPGGRAGRMQPGARRRRRRGRGAGRDGRATRTARRPGHRPRPASALMVRAADCVPVLLADPTPASSAPRTRAGPALVAGIVAAPPSAAMRDARRRRDLTAWVGPARLRRAATRCPQQMQDEVAARRAGEPSPTTSWGTPSLDVGAGVRAQLERAGVEVVDVGRCTRESPDLFSYRRDGARPGGSPG